MASAAQIAANRANARRSTGPRSAEGKARSRANALSHGIYAERVALPGDDPAAFEALLADLMAEFQPYGRYETALVRRLADIWRRLGHSAAIEARLLTPAPASPAARAAAVPGPIFPRAGIPRAGIPSPGDLRRLNALGGIEMRLQRALHHVVQMLERRQALRRRMGKSRPDQNNRSDRNEPTSAAEAARRLSRPDNAAGGCR